MFSFYWRGHYNTPSDISAEPVFPGMYVLTPRCLQLASAVGARLLFAWVVQLAAILLVLHKTNGR
jgi:hypothetical protein